MMKAAVYDNFRHPIKVQNVVIPKVPDDGVLIQVMATGVCRSDWHGWCGHDSDIIEHGLPFVPGHEFSGIIVALGTQLKRRGRHRQGQQQQSHNNNNNNRTLQVGMNVVVPFILSCGNCLECIEHKSTVCLDQKQPGFTQWGSFAEYVAIPRAERNVCVLPKYPSGNRIKTVSFIEAAALGCRFTTAYRAVVQRGLNMKQLVFSHDDVHTKETTKRNNCKTLAVFGCGGLGLSCIMIGKATGCFETIIAVDVSTKALEKALEVGATKIVQAERDKDFELREKVLKLTPHDSGADVSIDAAGFKSTCENAIYCTRRGGRMVQVGLPLSGVEDRSSNNRSILPEVPMARVAGHELTLVGSHGIGTTDMEHVVELVARGLLDPNKLIEQCVSLEEGIQALMDMDHGSPLGITMITKFNNGDDDQRALNSTSRSTHSSRDNNKNLQKQQSKL